MPFWGHYTCSLPGHVFPKKDACLFPYVSSWFRNALDSFQTKEFAPSSFLTVSNCLSTIFSHQKIFMIFNFQFVWHFFKASNWVKMFRRLFDIVSDLLKNYLHVCTLCQTSFRWFQVIAEFENESNHFVTFSSSSRSFQTCFRQSRCFQVFFFREEICWGKNGILPKQRNRKMILKEKEKRHPGTKRKGKNGILPSGLLEVRLSQATPGYPGLLQATGDTGRTRRTDYLATVGYSRLL